MNINLTSRYLFHNASRIPGFLPCVRFLRGQSGRSRTENKVSLENAVPLREEQLIRLQLSTSVAEAKQRTILEQKQQQKAEKQKVRFRLTVDDEPLSEPVTVEDQYEKLAATVTPLYKMSYQRQLKMKHDHIAGVLTSLRKKMADVKAPFVRVGKGLPCQLDPVKPALDILSYRNKDEFCIYRGADGNPKTVGFFVGRLTDPLMTCVPPSYLINIRDSHKKVAMKFQEFIRASPHLACFRFEDGGIWRRLIVRSNMTGDLMACIYFHPQDLSLEAQQEVMEDIRKFFVDGPGQECGLTSLYAQSCVHVKCSQEQSPYQLLAGCEYITEKCLGLTFHISPDSFFQINTSSAEILYSTVREVAEVSPITTLLDICCGTGTVSLVMAPHVRGTVGIESVTAAVANAKKNATTNGITNSVFIAGRAEKVMPVLAEELKDCTDVVAVVNPSRGGLTPSVIRSIRDCEAISKLVYISCKPEGIAMQNFLQLSATIGKSSSVRLTPLVPKYAVPVDIFPHTNHVELVMLFERIREMDLF